MVRTIKNCHLIILMMAFIPFLFLSCVDQQYDLSQIDKEVVVLREIEMPVGNLKPISIADFLAPCTAGLGTATTASCPAPPRPHRLS